MNEYNEKWTREKFLEYRKLKRSGYTHTMLKEHFGEDIYYSGLYNKNTHVIPYEYFIKYFENKLNEIKVNPEEVQYTYLPSTSPFYKSKTDYILSFYSNDLPYVISLMWFPINNITTYNIVFTTRDQWNDYDHKLRSILKNGKLTDKDYDILDEIIGKETKMNDLFPIFRKISWILLDFYNKQIKGQFLSIGETNNKVKINLYRNIIKDSFTNIIETEEISDGHKYYIYKIGNY